MSVPAMLAIDLDGTLLRSDGSVSERTRAALAAAGSVGVRRLIVTARPPRNVGAVLVDAGMPGIAACINGALIHDFSSARSERHVTLEPGDARSVVSRVRSGLPGVAFAAESGWRFCHEPGYVPAHLPPKDAVCGPAGAWIDRPLSKLLVRHPELAGDRLVEAVAPLAGEGVYVTHCGDAFAEITHPSATKAAATAWLAERWCISSDDVVAFGDMPNDLPVFDWAGRSVAVANAAPAVLAAADEITASNDEDGVAATIERLLAD